MWTFGSVFGQVRGSLLTCTREVKEGNPVVLTTCVPFARRTCNCRIELELRFVVLIGHIKGVLAFAPKSERHVRLCRSERFSYFHRTFIWHSERTPLAGSSSTLVVLRGAYEIRFVCDIPRPDVDSCDNALTATRFRLARQFRTDENASEASGPDRERARNEPDCHHQHGSGRT